MHKLSPIFLALFTLPAAAVSTSYWTHSSEADFNAGSFDQVVVTNLGDVTLSRAVATLLEQDPRLSMVNALAEAPDGSIYVATGPEGLVLRLQGENITTAAVIPDAIGVHALLFDARGRLLVGTEGERGRVLRFDAPDGPPTVLFEDDQVQYVWAMHLAADGMLYLATGPNGKLIELNPDGHKRVLLDSSEYNLRSLTSDGNDLLFAGSDPNGRVYRVNRRTGEVFVLYEAAESEIRAMVLSDDGHLYVATAQPVEPGPGATLGPPAPGAGRPEVAPHGVPLPVDPPADPIPPPAPDPAPGEPPRIPTALPPLPSAEVQAEAGAPSDAEVESDPENGPEELPAPPAANDQPDPVPPPVHQSGAMPGPAPAGNAIYRIDPDGFVTEIFRGPAMVFSLIQSGQTLLAGTGGEGVIYQIDPAADEVTAVARLQPQNVTALLPASDGRIYIGTANVGSLLHMSAGFASRGDYTSPILDAAQISRFGTIQLDGRLPDATVLRISTRSGNVRDPGAAGWSDWTEPVPATRFLTVQSPSARFLQYRLHFSTDGPQSPVVEQVRIAYQMPNLAPQLHAVVVGPAGENPQRRGTAIQRIAWQATDPNNDALQYSIYYRPGQRGPWILLQDEMSEPTLDWDTRLVPDGRYQIRIVASDERANPAGMGKTASRLSEPLVVDNTPPVIGNLAARPGANHVRIEATVVDRTSTVASFEYSVNSAADWQAVLPVDMIFDSPEERVSFTIAGLSSGTHQVTLRATDVHGNQGFESLLVEIP